MTTRGKYNSNSRYRDGKKRGYNQAKHEFFNALSEITYKHMSAMEREILDWRLELIR